MWLVPLPSNVEAGAHIQTALTYVDGRPVFPISAQETADLLTLYDAFDANGGKANQAWEVAGLSADLREALHEAYDQVQKGKRLRDLRATLLEAASRCPLCGISAVTDLDHHLPRSKFKAFSIYCRNLVPACSPCNNAKRALSGMAGDEFIYAYGTGLPDERFFTATCDMQGGALAVTFQIVRTPALSQEAFEVLCYQIYRLDLNKRLAAECIMTLGSHVVSLVYLYGADRNAVRVTEWCRLTAQSNIRQFGLNDWRTALFFGLADCMPFCDGGFETALGRASPYGP